MMIMNFLKCLYKLFGELEPVHNGLIGLQLRNKSRDSSDTLLQGYLTLPILSIRQSSCDNGKLCGFPNAREEV